ncbi:App1 family protein [Noviherbaspirillum sp.]|mgnify:CR=1 FL=1|uniref:App1 family protein n=1 Tax=Noviherbaspirillum sp. TaxID=1926288 RepID=UPI002FE20030
MRFLLLTRAGFDDVASQAGLAGTSLYVPPDLLSAQEIDRLRQTGADIHVLPAAIDTGAAHSVHDAAQSIRRDGGGPVWVEGASMPADTERNPIDEPPVLAATAPTQEALHHRVAKTAGTLAGQALRHLGKNFSPTGRLVLIPYLGYGNPQRFSVRGRLLEDEGLRQQSRDDSRWSNFMHLYKRLESDEVAGARIRARFGKVMQETVTDHGGYFAFDIVPEQPVTGSGWHTVDLELMEPLPDNGVPVRATAEVLVPPSTARFGVISDIDDTVLWTNVTNRLNMLRMLARSNAHTRKPFKGVAAFYRALRDGASGNEGNPVFYVSSSPWHLFNPLVEFLRLQDIPLGPLMLKELDVRKLFGPGRHRTHKLDRIEDILGFYPHLPFILIGDSGEQDPEIYAELVKRHPKQIRVIYIRNVNPDPARIEALDHLIDEVRASGAQLILAPDSISAAAHAAGEGLIRVDGMANVRSETKKDEAGSGAAS